MEKEEMLDGAESQNYGYGYGTKVRLPCLISTMRKLPVLAWYMSTGGPLLFVNFAMKIYISNPS